MRLTGDWRREIREAWDIRLLPVPMNASLAFWLTRCSPVKANRPSTPRMLYQSRLTQPFFRFVESERLRFGVLSDLYGIHLDREELPPYDVHPSQLGADDKERLGTIVGKKVRDEGFEVIVFYNSSPLRSLPYFEILSHAGLQTYFTTRLPEVPR